jgi:hypothetical protein
MSHVSRFTTNAAEVLVVIDSGVTDFQLLAKSVMNGATLLVLEPHRDGIQQITEAQQRYGANILHIVSHGAPGCLYLGNTELSLETLDRYTEHLKQWFETSQKAELILYGCNVAAGDAGSEFLGYLHHLTGASIAASTNLTGHRALGGDWVLERAIGAVRAPLAFHPDALEQYPAVLSHFASGVLGWEPVSGNTASFEGLITMRRSYFGTPAVGDVVLIDTLNFGDGSTSPLYIRVTQVNTTNDVLVGEIGSGTTPATFQPGIPHTYATTGNFTAFFDTSARLTTLKNNNGGTIRMETTVNIGTSNAPPQTQFPSGIQVEDNTLSTVQIQATDPNGDTLRYRLATNAESKSTEPPSFSVSSTGLITFDVRDSNSAIATVPGDKWNGQIIIEDLDALNNVKSKISLDLTIVVSGPNQAPTASAGGPYTVQEGKGITLTGSAADPDGFVLDREWDLDYDGVTFNVDAIGAFPTFAAPVQSGGTTKTVAFRARDTLSANSGISTALVTITQFPTPSSPDLTAATDTGVSNTDNFTSNNLPIFTGTAPANSTVELFAGGTSLGTVTANASGNWTFSVSPALLDGTYNITSTARDAAGNISSPSSPLAVTIDTVAAAPSMPDLIAASDTGSSNTDNITSVNTPTFVGTAEPNATVELFAGITSLGTVIADGAGNWSFPVSGAIADGTYNITAVAKDNAGNTSAPSAALPVTIDTGVPTTPSIPDLVAASDSGSSNTDNYTNVNTPTFTGTADPNATVELFAGITSLGIVTADGSGNWSLPVSGAIADGTYNITAVVTDPAGNTATSAPLSVTIDTTVPNKPSNVDLTPASDNGASQTDHITTVTTPTVIGKAEPNSTLQLYDAFDVQIGTVTADNTGDWSYTFPTPLSVGSYVVKARAVDKAGNISPVPMTHVDDHVEFDIVAPAVTPTNLKLDDASNTGSKADTLTSDDTPTITGKATPGVNVELRDGATVLGVVVADPVTGDWSYTPPTPWTEGNHPFTAYELDKTGVYSSPASLPVTIDKTAPGAPTNLDLVDASDDGTSMTDNITSDNTPTITGKAEANSAVELFDGTTSLGTVTADGSGNWTFTPSNPLAIGTYNITTKTTDAAGNISPDASAVLPITIVPLPGVPYNLDLTDASDTGVSSTDDLTNDNTPTINGKADPNTTVVIFDGSTALGEATTNAAGDWTFTPPSALADGVHPISAKTKDAAGNLGTGAAPLNITIDATAPIAPSSPNLVDSSDTGTSNTDNITGDNTPTLNGTAPLDAKFVELFAGTTSLGKVPVDASGNWSFTPTTPLADNTYSITVKAIDAAGNASLASPPLSVTIDALPPKVTFTPLQTNDTTPALTGKIDDPNAVVEVKINGVTYSATNKGDGTWFIPDNTIAPLTEGGFDILVTAKDKQGNSGTDNGGSGAGGAGSTPKALTIDKTAPIGAILTVTPTPNGVNTVAIQFTEPVTNFDISDLQLTRSADGVDTPVSLAGAKLTSTDGGKTWALTNIAGITKLTGDYKLTLNRSDIKDLAGNGIAAGAISSFRLGDDCVFGTPLAVPKLKGKLGIKRNGNGGGNSLGGGKGKDQFKGLNGNDHLAGGGGSDRLDGGQGKDTIAGGTGRDIVMGGAGKDKAKGGGGKDMLTGGGGKDLLVGGKGPDILIGGAKNDVLKGGKGKDMFVFNGLASEGNDLIKRFETQRDVIDLRPVFARAEFTGTTPDAKFHKYIQTVQVGASTEVRVDLDGAGSRTVFGAIATLKNINASTVSCSNFVVA